MPQRVNSSVAYVSMSEQQRVDAGLSGRRYYAVGVNEMLCVVGKLYVRQVVDLIYACGGRERHNHCKDI